MPSKRADERNSKNKFSQTRTQPRGVERGRLITDAEGNSKKEVVAEPLRDRTVSRYTRKSGCKSWRQQNIFITLRLERGEEK